MKKALITGITGQDGSHLADLLLEKGYKVSAIYRRTSLDRFERIEHIKDKLNLICADVTDQSSLNEAIRQVEPDEVYNLAAQSFVPESWTQPILTSDVTGLGALRVMEAIRLIDPKIKFYQASSSEMFGFVQEMPQTEKTQFYPRSPYGISKLFAHWVAKNYRESYKMFCASGILFNHEGPRRGLMFVTRKITHAVARIKHGLQKELFLGNLEAKRDWGYAPDYVKAMWLMLQQEKADDFVIATGEAHSVKEFCKVAFEHVGLNYEDYVKVDQKFFRPAEVQHLLGDATKAQKVLGWKPEVGFEQLVKIMVDNDMKIVKKQAG